MKKITIFVSELILAFFLISGEIYAADRVPLFDLSGELPEMSPEIKRREVAIPNIDGLDVEIGFYGGMLNVEDFGANYLYGASIVFHVTEDFFLTANYGRSQIKDDTFQRLKLPLFGESGKRSISDKNILLGWNFLSGEMFWSKETAYTSDLYLLAGAGSVSFDKDDYFNIIGGIGIKILFTDWIALKFEAKVSQYDSNFLGYEKKSHNTDITTGISIFY